MKDTLGRLLGTCNDEVSRTLEERDMTLVVMGVGPTTILITSGPVGHIALSLAVLALAVAVGTLAAMLRKGR